MCSVSVPLGNKTDQKLSSPFLISKTCILIYKTCPLIHDMKHARIEIKFYNLDTFKKQIASRTNSKNRFCLMRPPARLRQTLQSAIRESLLTSRSRFHRFLTVIYLQTIVIKSYFEVRSNYRQITTNVLA